MKPEKPRALWYVATCGDAAANKTGCLVAVEFFTCPLAYGRAIREAMKEHGRGELDSYTHGVAETESEFFARIRRPSLPLSGGPAHA